MPRVTMVVFWTPLLSTLTVETFPEVVIAALGSKSTFVADCTTIAASASCHPERLGCVQDGDGDRILNDIVGNRRDRRHRSHDAFQFNVRQGARVTDAGWCTWILIASASATSATSWNDPRL